MPTPDKPPKPAAKAASPAQKAERDAKSVLARHTHCANELAKMKAAVADPRTLAWAQGYVDTATSAQASLTGIYGQSPFPNELRAASLSPVLMKQLKKEYGDSFLSKIIQLTTEQEPHVKDMEDALGNFAVTREALNKRVAEPNAKKARTNQKDANEAV